MFELGDFSFVILDFFDVLSFNEGLLALNFFIFSFKSDNFKAEVVKLFFHFLAFDQLLTQFGHSFIPLK